MVHEGMDVTRTFNIASVQFYNADGHLLGSKESLLHILEQTTGIRRQALQ